MANLHNLCDEIDSQSLFQSVECKVIDYSSLISSQKDNLTLISQNIRSINCNISNFEVLLTRLGVAHDVVILSECWLSCAPSIPHLNGYSSYSTTRNHKQNDGVVAYINNSLSYTVEEPDCQDCNALIIKIDNRDVAIIGIYRSPSYTKLNPFFESLNQILKSLSHYKNIVLMGDINLDLLDNSKDDRDTYLMQVAFHGLSPTHDFVTRDAAGTCVDHVLLKTNFPSLSAVIQTSVTDHKAVTLSLRIKQTRQYATTIINKINYEALHEEINKIDTEPILKSNDPNSMTNLLLNNIKNAIDKHTTSITLPRRKRIIKPWITPGLMRCMRNRDLLHRKCKSNPEDITLKITYTRYRNFCCNLLKKIKRAYEKGLVEEAGKNPKKLWDTIKKITNTNRTNNYPKELLSISKSPISSVNVINTYFSNVGKALAENILNLQQVSCDIPSLNPNTQTPPIHSFAILDTDETEVKNLILSLRNNCAVGWDGITNRILKQNLSFLVPILTSIFNKCLQDGVFPTNLKQSQVIPIHKGGDKDKIINYRPISILPSLSKILEKIVNNRLVSYIEDNCILSNKQFGFRRGKSTDDAVNEFVDHVSKNLDKGNKCLSIFLDLAKAFDSISIPILLQKLEHIGIRGLQLNFFRDYLSNREQCVRIGEYVSSNAPISYGVPQGSILGPTLFIIYLNDLLCLKDFPGKIISYADDTALIFTADTWDDVYEQGQCGFSLVQNWLKQNILTLNTDKTKYLTFTLKLSAPSQFKIIAHTCNLSRQTDCACMPLQHVTHIKYLGVVIDQNLSFKQHIEQLSVRVRKLIYIFKTLRHILGSVALKQIYQALCQSIINYCILSWGGATKGLMKKIEVAQRAILKICTFKPILHPTHLLYEFCEVLTVRQMFLLRIVLKQHSELIALDHLDLTKRRPFSVPQKNRLYTKFINRFYTFLGPYIYNKLNKHLQIYSLNTFLCKRKTSDYLQKLTYDETETLLEIIS